MTEAVSPAPAACAPFSPETGPVPPRRMQGQRQPGLDILRCLAVVLVLAPTSLCVRRRRAAPCIT
ncbi:hypothetical protein [Verrucomicrobium spinosum]|uniref:hypothetical protein n=1 Tax=Verrucomicrobium spinosum TaxID=2736 RepID=UPI001C443DBF|nr:hypothetical protein [Verrucomicrobium spinosum]